MIFFCSSSLDTFCIAVDLLFNFSSKPFINMPEFCFLSQNKAYLSQDHATCHIHKYMLLGKNGRQKTSTASVNDTPLYHVGILFWSLIPRKQNQLTRQWIDGNRLSAASMEYSQPASRSQIPFPSITGLVLVVGYARNMIRHTQRDIISAVKTVNLFPLLPCHKDIIHCPEYITAKIDNQKLRHKWESQIKITFYIVMIPTACDRPWTGIYKTVKYKWKTRGKSPYAGTIPVTYFQKRFINSRLIILLISGIKHILLLLTSNSHSITVGAYGFN